MKLVDKIISLDQLNKLGLIDLYGDLKEKEFWEYAADCEVKGFQVIVDKWNKIDSLVLSIIDIE